METCPHGVPKDNFCCKCKYGEMSHVDMTKNKVHDVVEQLNKPFGKQINGGYYD